MKIFTKTFDGDVTIVFEHQPMEEKRFKTICRLIAGIFVGIILVESIKAGGIRALLVESGIILLYMLLDFCKF